MKRWVLVMALACVMVTYALASITITRTEVFDFTIDITQETTKVVKVGDDWVVLDSFAYADSFSVSGDTTTHVTVTWTSPAQKMTSTLVFDASTTYTCSLNTGAGATGFDLDATALTTLAQLTAAFADSVNDVDGMKDTIIAADSGTFVQITSRLAQTALTSKVRWTLSMPVSGGAGTNDTASLTTNSIAIIQDSMVANVNASDSAGFYVTAANSGDTAHTLTSNQPGLFFFVASLPQDTAGDTVTTRVNTSAARKTERADTIYVASLFGRDEATIIGKLIIEDPSGIAHGVGLSDSVYFDIYTQLGGGSFVEVYRDSANALPATFNYTQSGTVLGTDTLFKDNIIFVVTLSDTTTDSAFTIPLVIKCDLILRD